MHKLTSRNKAVLLLEDETVITGNAIGKLGTTTGEICFNTGATGYQEVYTDPSYFGQILVHTSPHIGNYGTADDETESDSIKISGLVCKNFSSHYSGKQATKSLQDYLVDNKITGIEGVDTRALVQHIRNKGAMNCILSSETDDLDSLKALLTQVPSLAGQDMAGKVGTKSFYSTGDEHSDYRIAVIDFGIKKSILRYLNFKGMFCGVFPPQTNFEEIKLFNPDGIVLSNGPGDPAPLDYAVKTVQTILTSRIPLFGICLGHQLLGIAYGMETFKMHYGHRGLNHPVKNLKTGLCEITSQNHGFALKPQKVKNLEVTHINLNDHSIEGIRAKDRPAFSVQYHPESSPGPNDSRYLFDQFIQLIDQQRVSKSTIGMIA